MAKHFSKLESKFTFMYTAILVAVIVCIACSIGNYSASILKRKSTDSCIQKLDFVGERFELILSRIQNESLLLTLNQAARYEQASRQEASPYEEHMDAVSFSSYLVEFLATQSAVESISYYSKGGAFFYQDSFGGSQSVRIEIPHEVRMRFMDSKEKSFWYIDEGLTFTCLKKSYAFTGEPLGFFALSVSPEEIRGIYKNFFEPGEIFMIVDLSGRICAGTEPSLSGQNRADLFPGVGAFETGKTIAFGSGKYLCTVKELTDFTFLALTPESYVYRDSHRLVLVILAIGIMSSIITFFLFHYSTGKVMAPVKQIIAKVRSMSEGNYHERIAVSKSPDEISLLAAQINQMALNTQELLERVRWENEEKRRYELSCLQLQMQPHFLYNTLETLCGMIEMNDKRAAIDLVSLISTFYRGALNKGKEIITLEQEINITRAYLSIMQKRYPNAFHFSFSIDPRLLASSIPKLTLQPLVENSIIHGLNLQCQENSGSITIEGKSEGPFVCLKIRDNGQGMDEDALRQLNSQMFTEEKSSFGIRSIEKRLRLYFEIAEISVNSCLGEGTVITIRLPKGQEA